jgi:hypothetical protein
MAFITTGRPGDDTFDTPDACVTQPCLFASVMEQCFRIQPGQTEIPISLSYEFVTEEVPQYLAYPNAWYGDGFQISLQIESDGTIDSIHVLAHGHSSNLAAQMTELPATPLASLPSGGSPLYHTGWQPLDFSIPLSAEVTSAGGMGRLRFTVFDGEFFEWPVPGTFDWTDAPFTDSALFSDGIKFEVDE